MKILYRELFEKYSQGMNMRGVPSWDDSAVFVSMKGKCYSQDKDVRLMVVGRAPNGWDYDQLCYDNPEAFGNSAEEVFNNDSRFMWVTENEEKYSLSASTFWRVIKRILVELTNEDSIDWYENIIWSNLYKVAKQERVNGKTIKNLNPNTTMCRLQYEVCKKILCKEIEIYSPTHILFITDYKDWIADKNHHGEMSFEKNLLSVKQTGDMYVEAIGNVIGKDKIKVIITKRPDALKKGETEIEYVREVLKYC